MWWLIILTLHKSFIVCQIQSPQATWATDFYESTFQRCESTIHIIFNYVRAEQDHCLYNITGWRKWDSALLPRELTGSRWRAERGGRPRERCWSSSRPLHNSLFHHGGRPAMARAAVGGRSGWGAAASWHGQGKGRGGRGVITFTGLLFLPYASIFLLKRRKIKSCCSGEVNPFLPQATK